MVWVASLTFVAQAVKKKIATEKKFRRAFLVAKKFEKDYLKFFLILQREIIFIGLRESTRKMSYASALAAELFSTRVTQKFSFSRSWTALLLLLLSWAALPG